MNGADLAIPDLSTRADPRRTTAPALLEQHESFADALGRASERAGESPEQTARRAAEQLVAGAFIRPVLAQIREATMAAPPFRPTQGERQFRAIADARVAEAIVHGANLPLIDRLTDGLIRRGGRSAPAPSSPVLGTNR